MADATENEYRALLSEVIATKPKTAAILKHAHDMRESKLREYMNGVRFAGFEELISHLELVESFLRNHSRLKKLAFLIQRSRGEFGVALEALLSGLHAVAHDAMRAVMEVEFLLRDFS